MMIASSSRIFNQPEILSLPMNSVSDLKIDEIENNSKVMIASSSRVFNQPEILSLPMNAAPDLQLDGVEDNSTVMIASSSRIFNQPEILCLYSSVPSYIESQIDEGEKNEVLYIWIYQYHQKWKWKKKKLSPQVFFIFQKAHFAHKHKARFARKIPGPH